jgi:CHAT domain-containing protein/tetratricopeptide (TPR) repeat protein
VFPCFPALLLLLHVQEPSPDPLASAKESPRAVLDSAHAERLHGSLTRAAAQYLRAAELAGRAGEQAAHAAALIGLSTTRASLAPLDSALAAIGAAARIAPRNDPGLQAELRCVRGPILVAAGREGGDADARAGLALARQSRDDRIIALCWRALGIYLLSYVDDPVSAESFDSAEAHHRAAGDDAGLAETLVWSGTDHFSFFDDAKAKADFAAAMSMAGAVRAPRLEAWARMLLGRIAARGRDGPAALAQYDTAAVLLRPTGDRLLQGQLRRLQGSAALTFGRPAAAEAALLEAGEVAAGLGHVVLGFLARNDLVLAAGGRGDWLEARRRLAELTRFVRRSRLDAMLPGLAHMRAVVALHTGDTVSAIANLRTYLTPAHPEGAFARHSARAYLALIHAARGEIAPAIAELTAASDELDARRAALDDAELRTFVFQTASPLDPPDYGFATAVAAIAAAGDAATALELAERRRARELADRLVRDAAVSPDATAGRSSAGAQGSRFAVTRLQAALDSGTALIAFVTGRPSQPTTAITVTRSTLRSHRLPPIDSLDAAVSRLLALLDTGADPRGPAAKLGSMLLEPVLGELPTGVERLILVPDDVLHRIPFDLLAVPGSSPLVLRYVISRAPSAALALRLLEAPAVRLRGVLAFGDPAFAREVAPGSAAAIYRSAFDESGGLERLRSSAREARLVGAFGAWSSVRLREDASEAFLKRTPLDRFGVVHFATHALVSDWSPARTALALAPGSGEDGFVGAAEAASLRLGAGLVVLSACRTAGGMVVGGEGVQGLTAPLLQAGARTIVATLWPVRDVATVALMRDFYRALAAGTPAAGALRAARLAAVRRGSPARDWAAFTLIGDPMLRPELRDPGRRRLLLGTLALLGLAAAAGVLYRGSRRQRPPTSSRCTAELS